MYLYLESPWVGYLQRPTHTVVFYWGLNTLSGISTSDRSFRKEEKLLVKFRIKQWDLWFSCRFPSTLRLWKITVFIWKIEFVNMSVDDLSAQRDIKKSTRMLDSLLGAEALPSMAWARHSKWPWCPTPTIVTTKSNPTFPKWLLGGHDKTTPLF